MLHLYTDEKVKAELFDYNEVIYNSAQPHQYPGKSPERFEQSMVLSALMSTETKEVQFYLTNSPGNRACIEN